MNNICFLSSFVNSLFLQTKVKTFLLKMALLNLAVDFRSRRFAFRGAGAEPPRRFTPAGSHLSS